MEPLYILQWHKDMGIELLTEELAVNNFVQKSAIKKISGNIQQNSKDRNESSPIITSFSQASINTKEIADNCTNLAELKAAICNFKGLAVTATATNTVFGDGNPNSKIMLIGEAPGAEEDKEGIPFCGQSGQLLSSILSYVNLKRSENYYITNSVFWRPPGNRKPTTEEIAVCKPFVEKHIALINPEIIVLIGSTAVSAILNQKLPITKIRGKILDYKNNYMPHKIAAMPILHPSYLLRSPGQKRHSWEDALTLKNFMDNKLAAKG